MLKTIYYICHYLYFIYFCCCKFIKTIQNMKKLHQKLAEIVHRHHFLLVDFQVFPQIGVVQFEILGKDYFPFDLFSELNSSLGCLSTLSPSLKDGKNTFLLVLRLESYGV